MQPFLGSIMVVSFNFPPKGWIFCNGQLLPINQNQAIFSLFGTLFGGDGRVNFGIPNLQGRAALGQGNGNMVGQLAGEAAHTLTYNEMPTHTHLWKATSTGPNSGSPANSVLAGAAMYAASASQAMAPGEISTAGGSQPHENQSPYLVLNFCVAMVGIYPTQN